MKTKLIIAFLIIKLTYFAIAAAQICAILN